MKLTPEAVALTQSFAHILRHQDIRTAVVTLLEADWHEGYCGCDTAPLCPYWENRPSAWDAGLVLQALVDILEELDDSDETEETTDGEA